MRAGACHGAVDEHREWGDAAGGPELGEVPQDDLGAVDAEGRDEDDTALGRDVGNDARELARHVDVGSRSGPVGRFAQEHVARE